jgi:hypothetical protein
MCAGCHCSIDTLLRASKLLVGFRNPEELRETLRANQKACYPLLMKAAGEAIIELARDPRYVGGTVGVLAVLHTWTQQLLYHPHVHCLVTGGGVADDNWLASRQTDYLVPTPALGRLVRGKLKALLAKRRPGVILPKAVWTKRWVAHATAWGEGAEAVLRYLARYVFRSAITNNRLVSLDETGVAFRHKHRASNRWRVTPEKMGLEHRYPCLLFRIPKTIPQGVPSENKSARKIKACEAFGFCDHFATASAVTEALSSAIAVAQATTG